MSVCVWSTPDKATKPGPSAQGCQATEGIDADMIRGANANRRRRRANGARHVSRCNQTFLWLSTRHAVAEIDNQQSLRILVMLS
jgi:hypothetical protein